MRAEMPRPGNVSDCSLIDAPSKQATGSNSVNGPARRYVDWAAVACAADDAGAGG